MKCLLVWALVVFAGVTHAGDAQAPAPATVVVFETNQGTIAIEVLTEQAPATAASFIDYVKSGFYDGTIFHRVIPDFVIQGGGFTPDMARKETRPPVRNEADNGLHNIRGTLSMARTPDPQSATSQFFINLADNPYLDHTAPTEQGWGYAVFARVVEGMDVVERIAGTETGEIGGMSDVPLTPMVLTRASVRGQP